MPNEFIDNKLEPIIYYIQHMFDLKRSDAYLVLISYLSFNLDKYKKKVSK